MHELRHRAFHDDRTLLLRVGEFEKRLTEHFSAAQRHRFHQAFALIEAATIAGFATGASKGWIYLRGEYRSAAKGYSPRR